MKIHNTGAIPQPATAPDEPLDELVDLARALGGDHGSFTHELLKLIAKAQATPANLGGLAAGFSRQVTAYRLWMAMSHSLGRSPTTDELLTALARPHFTCPRCGITSWHPTDAEQGYCGRCHTFTGEREP